MASVDGGILDKLDQAIDGTSGGVVLIPAGTHTLNRKLTLVSVEFYGTVLWAQCGQGLSHLCFGKGDRRALFNLRDRRASGITVIYSERDPANLDEYCSRSCNGRISA